MLKAVLASKAEVDALAEPLRKEYVEKDGKWVVDVEGGFTPAAEVLELKTKLSEFRDNNRAMHTELEKLKPLAAKYEGVDPDEYKTLKAEAAALKDKGIKNPSDIQAAIDKGIEAKVKPIQDMLTAEKAAREKAQKTADDSTFRELVTAEATKAGVAPTAMKHALREAEQVFELKEVDGKKVLSPKQGVKHPTDPMKDMTTDAWLTNLQKTDEFLFAPNTGGGAGGNGGSGGGGGKPGAKRLLNPTPEEMGQNADAIIKGEVIVVRQ